MKPKTIHEYQPNDSFVSFILQSSNIEKESGEKLLPNLQKLFESELSESCVPSLETVDPRANSKVVNRWNTNVFGVCRLEAFPHDFWSLILLMLCGQMAPSKSQDILLVN